MAYLSSQLPLPLPQALQPWLTLNPEYHVIICHRDKCQQAQAPTAVSRHLRDKHQAKYDLRKQVEEYIRHWQWPYDFRNIPLPPDGSFPQPVLPVVQGFQCQDCQYKTQSRPAIRQHGSIKHGKKRFEDNKVYKAVQLQTWFGERRERYWVVDATRPSRDISNTSG